MFDFLMIGERSPKRGVKEIYPDFIVKKSSDLMIRGSDFYAIWVEDLGLWSTDESDLIRLIDKELDAYAAKEREHFDGQVKVSHMRVASTGAIDRWHKYCKMQMRESYHPLDEKIIFSNANLKKTDYVSKYLPYPLEKGDYAAYEELISTLYTPEERMKIEWAIGAIVTGDSKKIQKFLVLYGSAGTGKSTILNIIQMLFEGYYSVFDARALGSTSNSFALEAFKSNPLVAIQHDGDLSHIEDNTRLNSIVSHELMTVNEKFKSTYTSKFKCFLFMGTNRPVKITDAKSGLIRRLIDVTPSGNKLSQHKYNELMNQIQFELGAIAYHCMEFYSANKHLYDDYIPVAMMGASNDFYNFVLDSYDVFDREDGTTLKAAWEMYKVYCEEAKAFQLSQRVFKEELKNYFDAFAERDRGEGGSRPRNVYTGFKRDRFREVVMDIPKEEPSVDTWLKFNSTISLFDEYCKDCPAQYASTKEAPIAKWEEVTTTLEVINTKKLHYVKVPETHIVIDFDIPDENGKKCFAKNLEAASKWPKTYAELSKSGEGIHLHYIYNGGDPTKLLRVHDDHIEVKVFNGGSSLRRKLTKCNDIPISTISSGLATKGETTVTNVKVFRNSKDLMDRITKVIHREYPNCPGTKSGVDLIKKMLDDAYESGMIYDAEPLRRGVTAFAMSSKNHADYCIKLVDEMKWHSEQPTEVTDYDEEPLVYYDIEVFPNLLLINYKKEGEGEPIYRMINPSPSMIEELIKKKLVGFNCRRYDNHILYARLMGYNTQQIYKLSQRIISGEKDAFFSDAYDISYTDIYDFASSTNKKSLKKLEIEMGIHHQELGLPWDEPVPEELWGKVSEYCDNDVLATEAAFKYLSADWTARLILSDIADMKPNDTTNSLTTRIIFGKDKNPQTQFCYRDLSQPVTYLDPDVEAFLKMACPKMMEQKHICDGVHESLLPYFPGYKYDHGVSTYLGEEIGEGGLVRAEPGIYFNVALLDVSSMHPHSVIAECLFGPEYTVRYRDIVEGRVSIKHEDWEIVKDIIDGKMERYVAKVLSGEMTSKQLADALKTAINSVYGLTSAKFDNPFRDKRNIDNIVAKRGALFMLNLKHEVEERGFTVAHIKTDSIKIPNATPEIIQFVMDYGERYGYSFEHEATYERMCLVNDAVYIAKYTDGHWSATGKQFAVPYVFKTLFSKKPITFEDKCETFNVAKGALYIDTNETLPDVTDQEKLLAKYETQYRKGTISDTMLQKYSEELRPIIESGHAYHFVGRVGQFCPIVEGHDAGELVCLRDNKYSSPPGAKGYRWMESEIVKELHLEDSIDMRYYQKLVTDAMETIMAYGDFDRFIYGDPYDVTSNDFVNP
ncbi:MAG: hypothetical protein KBT27_09345 [Prevotellaceae bacterium]|nr:hypothetical protein [Candidatus Faecinaster equi]